jgi:hypothetical protein
MSNPVFQFDGGEGGGSCGGDCGAGGSACDGDCNG